MRILVADDDRYLNKLISDHLLLHNFEVESCLDGEAALDALEKNFEKGTPIDLLIVDMLLPKIMGAELLTKINENSRFDQLRKIAISGIYKEKSEIEQICMLHSIEDYWVKPFDLQEKVNSLQAPSDLPKPIDQRSLSLKGKIDDRPIEKLFFDAYDKAFTGRLHLRFEERRRRIYFLNGHPVSADSSVIQESLGESLIQVGLITDEQRQEASRVMVEKGSFLGETLVELGHITNDQLFKALRNHTQQLILRAFFSRQGEFEFESLTSLPSHIPHLEFNPFLIMLRAQKKFIRYEALKSLYQIKNEAYPLIHDRLYQIIGLLDLPAEHQEILQNLDPRETLQNSRDRLSDETEEPLLRALYLMESIQLLDWVAEPSESAQRNEVQVTAFESSPHTQVETSDPANALLKSEEEIFSEYMDTLNKDFFELLGVSADADENEIEETYRKMRFQKHPDRYGNRISGQTKRILDDILSRLDSAYQTLINDETREEYLAHIKQQSTDSATDSKRYLAAQEVFRQALKELDQERFDRAIEFFERATQTWQHGVEYRLYKIFTEFKRAVVENDKESVRFEHLKRLRELAYSQPSSDTGFLLLGHAYRLHHDNSSAIEAYRKCLQVNENRDEAANALAHLVGSEQKRVSWSHSLRKSWKPLLRFSFLTALSLGAFAILYYGQDLFIYRDKEVLEPNKEMISDIMPALSIRLKRQAGKIVLQKGWLEDSPTPVLKSKCRQVVDRLNQFGTEELFLLDADLGFKASCNREKIQRH